MTTEVVWLGSPLVEEEDTVPELLARRTRPALNNEQAEDVALLSGLKPLVYRTVPPGELQRRAEFFRQRGLFTEEISALAAGGLREDLLVAGRREPNVKEVAQVLAQGVSRWTKRDHQRIGTLLGYPPCCVSAFGEAAEEQTRMERAAARTRGPGEPWLNVLDPWIFRLVSWEPCSFQCHLSLVYTQRLEALLKPHFRPFLHRTREALAAARLYLSPGVQLSMEGESWDDGFLPRYVAPTARDRDPFFVLSRSEEVAVARALREVRAAQKITTYDGQLWLDGAPWARGFLVRFRG